MYKKRFDSSKYLSSIVDSLVTVMFRITRVFYLVWISLQIYGTSTLNSIHVPPYDPPLRMGPFFDVPISPFRLLYGQHGFQDPDNQPGYCDSRDRPICALDSDADYCLTDPHYPHNEITAALHQDFLLAHQFADEKNQSAGDLVDFLEPFQEEHFDYSHYSGDPYTKGNWIGNRGYICPSRVEYARLLRARNVRGEWRVIVNDLGYYTQTQRIEVCLYPNVPCRTLAPCIQSQCVQKHVHHRILSYDLCHPWKGIFVDVYKLPSSCSCKIFSSFSNEEPVNRSS